MQPYSSSRNRRPVPSRRARAGDAQRATSSARLSFAALLSLALVLLPRASRADLVIGALRDDGTVVLLDGARLTERATVAAGRGPLAVAPSPRGDAAFVTNYAELVLEQGGARVVSEPTVTVIDLRRGAPAGTIPLGDAGKPHDVLASRAGDRLWVVSEAASAVLEVEVATRRVTRRWATRQRGSQRLCLAPDERWLYVGNVGSRSVTVIDRSTGSSRIVAARGGVDGMALSPDGRELWIAGGDSGRVTVFDARTLRVLATVAGVRGSPTPMCFASRGRELWLCGAEPPALHVYDVERRVLMRSVPLPESPRAVLEVSDGEALVSQPMARRLLRVEVGTGRVIATKDTGNGIEGLARVREDSDRPGERPATDARGARAPRDHQAR